jgi:uncharacterized protein
MSDKDLTEHQGTVSTSLITATPSSLTPVSLDQRIKALDILRGFALMGILLMNIEWFSRPIISSGVVDIELSGVDHAVGWLIRCFVEGKFYKLFALLFGMGFAVMLTQAIRKQRPFAAWFSRRMFVLFVIGIIHMFFVWQGDILHAYAVTGLLMLGFIYLLRTTRFEKYNTPSFILKIALWWLSIPILLTSLAGVGFGVLVDRQSLSEQWQEGKDIRALVSKLESNTVELATFESRELPSVETTETSEDTSEVVLGNATNIEVIQAESGTSVQDVIESDSTLDTKEPTLQEQAQQIFEDEQEKAQSKTNEIAALSDGSYWQATVFRTQASYIWLVFTPIFAVTLLLPLFLLGYWFVVSGTIKNHTQHAKLFGYMARIGLGVGLVVTVAGLVVMGHPAVKHIMPIKVAAGLLVTMGEFFMAVGYLGLLVRLLDSPKWQKVLEKLASMGRMALTNYIMHSLILTSIFYGYAGGWYGEIPRAPQMLIVIAIVLIQIPLSSLWLKYFQFGPLEWLWRSLTYKKWQSFRVLAN